MAEQSSPIGAWKGDQSTNLIVLGWLTASLGAVAIIIAFFLEISVMPELTMENLSSYADSGVINIGLLSNREMVLAAGAALMICGTVSASAGHIVKAIERLTASGLTASAVP